MKNDEGIHVLVRAVIIENGKLLVTTDVKRDVSFLPGGHIHHGEKAIDALKRELKEELGNNFQIDSLLGVIEDAWDYKGELYHGVHLLFRVSSNQPGLIKSLKSNESNLSLEWIPIDALSNKKNLFPKLLATKISQWQKLEGIELSTEWTQIPKPNKL